MRFVIVRPTATPPIDTVEADEDMLALRRDLFGDKGVDFGGLGRDHQIIVYEYGLYESADNGQYFRLGKTLYCGPAIIFAVEYGETRDVASGLAAHLLAEHYERFVSQQEVEDAIAAGRVTRPQSTVGDAVVWRWPDSKDSNPLLDKKNWGL